MNAQAQFLAWLRLNHPQVYQLSLAAALADNGVTREQFVRAVSSGGLHGLGQDDSIDLQPIDMSSMQLQAIDPSQIDLSSVADSLPSFSDSSSFTAPLTTSSSSSLNWTNILTSVIGGAATIGSAILGTNSSANSLLQTNAARVQQGLPPLNANGTVMTAAQMQAAGYTSAQINSLEAQLSGSTGLSTAILGLPLWLWLALGGGALLLVGRRRA